MLLVALLIYAKKQYSQEDKKHTSKAIDNKGQSKREPATRQADRQSEKQRKLKSNKNREAKEEQEQIHLKQSSPDLDVDAPIATLVPLELLLLPLLSNCASTSISRSSSGSSAGGAACAKPTSLECSEGGAPLSALWSANEGGAARAWGQQPQEQNKAQLHGVLALA